VFAAGDVANAFHPLLGKHIRVEHWRTRGISRSRPLRRCSAGRILRPGAYFYTDQYDLGMEYAGYVEPGGYEEVVFRGDVPGRNSSRSGWAMTAGCSPA